MNSLINYSKFISWPTSIRNLIKMCSHFSLGQNDLKTFNDVNTSIPSIVRIENFKIQLMFHNVISSLTSSSTFTISFDTHPTRQHYIPNLSNIHLYTLSCLCWRPTLDSMLARLCHSIYFFFFTEI